MRLNGINGAYTIRVGDFKYVDTPIKLGNNDGNFFEVTLRQIQASEEEAINTCKLIAERGFINYFGLQRFGKASRKSHELGKVIFRGDYKTFCDYLFEDSELDAKAKTFGDASVFKCKAAYREGDYETALKFVPNSLYREKQVLLGLNRDGRNYQNAFEKIPKNMRLIYLHAYQSFLWNFMASKRIEMSAFTVITGDLVLASDESVGAGSSVAKVVSDGEDEEDKASLGAHTKVHIVTEEEAKEGVYDITDVLLPLLGSEIAQPAWLAATADEGATSGLGFIAHQLELDGLSVENITQHPYSAYRMRGAYRYVSSCSCLF